MLDVRLLGAFDVKRDEKTVAIPSRPAQSLFAYLILTAGTAHRREKLAGLLWPDSGEGSARDYLRHGLWRIRKSIGAVSVPGNEAPYILADDIHISFNAGVPYSLDAMTVEKATDRAPTDELMGALSFYGGELLPGFYDEWIQLEREHLRAVYEHKMARLMSLMQSEKRWLDILEWGERWIAFGQKPEPAYRALMNAHAALGDMSKVAAIYERCVVSLGDLGVEPSQQTLVLYENLKSGREFEQESPRVAQVESHGFIPRTNLPAPLTSFVGREKEVEEVIRLLGQNRLITLTGPGGVGKTRLAIESSNRLLSKFKDGVWWAELAPLIDDGLVAQAIAQALGVREISGQPLIEALKNFLSEKQLLLVIDNCEHLISVSAQLADDLLTHCSNLSILATSREALGITGEMLYQVPALSLPRAQHLTLTDLLMEYEGIRLFVERAVAVNSYLTQQGAPELAPYLCWLDYPMCSAMRVKLVRTETIAQGCERCNFRFSRGQAVEVMPDFLKK